MVIILQRTIWLQAIELWRLSARACNTVPELRGNYWNWFQQQCSHTVMCVACVNAIGQQIILVGVVIAIGGATAGINNNWQCRVRVIKTYESILCVIGVVVSKIEPDSLTRCDVCCEAVVAIVATVIG